MNKLLKIVFGMALLMDCGHKDKCTGDEFTCIKDFPEDIVANLLFLSSTGFLNQRRCTPASNELFINKKVIRRSRTTIDSFSLASPILPNDKIVVTSETRLESETVRLYLAQCVGFWNFEVNFPRGAVDCQRIALSQDSRSQRICVFKQSLENIQIFVDEARDYSIEVVR